MQLPQRCLIRADLTSTNRTAINIVFESNQVSISSQTGLPGAPDHSTAPSKRYGDVVRNTLVFLFCSFLWVSVRGHCSLCLRKALEWLHGFKNATIVFRNVRMKVK